MVLPSRKRNVLPSRKRKEETSNTISRTGAPAAPVVVVCRLAHWDTSIEGLAANEYAPGSLASAETSALPVNRMHPRNLQAVRLGTESHVANPAVAAVGQLLHVASGVGAAGSHCTLRLLLQLVLDLLHRSSRRVNDNVGNSDDARLPRRVAAASRVVLFVAVVA